MPSSSSYHELVTEQPALGLGRTLASMAAITTTSTGSSLDLGADGQPDQAGPAGLPSIIELAGTDAGSSATALVHALLASFSVILVSELGDKTFIITAIMAMKNSRTLVFLSSALALFVMTVLSVGMGVAVTVIPDVYTHYASIVLFLLFGLKMLHEAYEMGDTNTGDQSEFVEVERELEHEELSKSKQKPPARPEGADQDQGKQAQQVQQQQQQQEEEPERLQGDDAIAINHGESHKSTASGAHGPTVWLRKLGESLSIAPVMIKVFTMIFVAEWGDRSQISTVILAAREDVTGVFVGSLSGHLLCTALAVIGGRFVADVISVRTMTLFGGVIFLFFAGFELLSGPEQQS